MNNIYKISNKDKSLLELLTSVILDNVEQNGTDILLGKTNYNEKINIKEKREFDNICSYGIDKEPEMQMSISKYTLNNKEYYHIGICSNNSNNCNEIMKDNNETIEKNNKEENYKKIKLTDRQLEIIKIINENPYIKYDEMKDVLGISKGTVCIEIRLLKRLKILERVGTVDGKWIVNKSMIDK